MIDALFRGVGVPAQLSGTGFLIGRVADKPRGCRRKLTGSGPDPTGL